MGTTQECSHSNWYLIYTGGPSQSSKSRKRNKGHPIGKKEAKLSLFADDIFVITLNSF